MPEVLLQLPRHPRRKDPALDPKPPLTELQLQDHLASGSPSPPASSSPTSELQHRRTPGARHGRQTWSFDAAGHQGPDLDRPRRLRPGPSTQDMPLSSLSLLPFSYFFSSLNSLFVMLSSGYSKHHGRQQPHHGPLQELRSTPQLAGTKRKAAAAAHGARPFRPPQGPSLMGMDSPWPDPSKPRPFPMSFRHGRRPLCFPDSRAPYVAQWLSPLVSCWATREQNPVAALFFFSSNLLLQRSSSCCYLRYDRMLIVNTKTHPDRPVDPARLQHCGQVWIWGVFQSPPWFGVVCFDAHLRISSHHHRHGLKVC